MRGRGRETLKGKQQREIRRGGGWKKDRGREDSESGVKTENLK